MHWSVNNVDVELLLEYIYLSIHIYKKMFSPF